ncbi:hypothetical protein [Actinomadura sp. HBU206391]|nr:hypothetical protein [Actinomadura sp. HBU206391]
MSPVAAGDVARVTRTVELITGRPAQTIERFVAERRDLFGGVT